ncbi:hypothetical protein [Marinobacter sp. AC-23]|uniref:hypothetical protein n=1 Tax=Marinobacter sp. AC-23 TaxID=1879031 RepID=UPI000914E552|nr:hypothetical protein [Marinobacter sp. AC-23]OHY79477.1 hypothetical protein BCA33_16140 [Marinobacter sp. AC-23]
MSWHGSTFSGMGEASSADPVKVSQWVESADEFQCKWAVKYLWNQAVPGGSLDLYLGELSRGQLAGLVEWMLCADGDSYGGSTFPMPINGVRLHGEEYFAKARNAWNQRVNRQKKASQSKNTIVVDPETKSKIRKLASEHNLKDGEFLSILIDLMSERRGAVEGIIRQRKEAKRAAIASDLGIFSGFGDSL